MDMRSIHADELVKVIEKQVGHGIYENNGDLRANIVYRGYTINFANAEITSLVSFNQTGINIERTPVLIFDPVESDDVNNDFFIVEEAIQHINNVIDNGAPFIAQ